MKLSADTLVRWTSSRYLGLIAVTLAVLLLAVNEISYYVVDRLTARNAVYQEVRSLSEQVRLTTLMMESAKRGYILTERDAYLAPYDRMNRQFDAMLGRVHEMAQEHPEMRDKLEALADAARRKRSEMAEVLHRYQSGNHAGAMDLVLTEIGRENMERIGQIVDEIRMEEAQAHDHVLTLDARVRFWSRLVLTGVVLAGLAAVFAFLLLVREREIDRKLHLMQLSAERDKLEVLVDHRTGELSDLARHLQRVREDERDHLARELHDELGGLLTAAKLDVARMRKRVEGAGPDAAERIRHLSQTLDAGIALKRRIIEDLRPSSLSNLGLQRALQIQCREFAQRSELHVEAVIADLRLDPERALAVYRVIQEALTNIAKYAQATEVRVLLQSEGDRALLRVEDNGRGFDTSQVRVGSHGLAGMRFRMRSCGGDLVLRSTPGGGTTIEATLPMDATPS
jgi:signal transduction histidine kinase